MATTSSFKKQFDQRRQRTFSESIRKEVVRKIENNLLTVREVSIDYQVSRTSVYNWVYKYSSLYKKGHRQIIEPMSSSKQIKVLKDKIKELEQIVGQKQIELDFLNKLIEIAEEDLGIDIKKKTGSKHKSGSGKTKKA
ncbi:MAG: transposase [Bacteroidetes bacterium]|nr:transposase [Bacteroidota bacterium]